MKIRIKFSKEGIMKFIGHLDMMRYFQKAFRRCGIDIAYSQGFSPHQLISFAAPLGVGLTSRGEYMDIVVNSTQDSRTMIERINAEMVEGVRVLSYQQIEDETKNSNAMAIVAAADYEVRFRPGHMPEKMDLKAEFEKFYRQEHIFVVKKTKKSEKEVDIKPMIFDLNVCEDCVYMKLATGSVENLKPEFVMKTFMGDALGDYDLDICRTEMYAWSDGEQKTPDKLVPLDGLGKVLL